MKKIFRFKEFATTAFIGGFAAILPLGLIIIVMKWIIVSVVRNMKPFIDLLKTDSQLSTIIAYVVSIVAIVLIFFLAGVFIKTSFGNMVRNYLEHTYLTKIPGYKTAKEIVGQFFGSNRSFFSEVVFIDPFKTGVLMTAFITDNRMEEYVTVFAPTGPNPTSGNIFHIRRSELIRSSAKVEEAVKSIIGCGAGSSKVFENAVFPTDII